MQADIVVTNARILTMDPARPAASAMAVANGRILAVGDATEVLPLAGNSTRIIDGAGRSLLPSGDIEAVAPEEINTLSPALTVCGGRVTFEA